MSLPVKMFEADGFRSLKSFACPVSRLDVFVGANGVGKTNMYRALELLRAAAGNTLARDLAADGGLVSALWAGPHRGTGGSRLRLAVDLEAPGARTSVYRYEIAVGFPPREAAAAFADEPQVKEEAVSHISGARRVRLVDRKGPSVMVRDRNGRAAAIDIDLLASETVLGRLEDPTSYPEIDAVRRTLLQWRFYHGLRTDAASPLRRPCPAVATATLASDGSDLAAVFATLAHIREDTAALTAAVDEAFPGAKLVIPAPDRFASFGMRFPDFPDRVFDAQELSDGTLRFLALAGACLSYRLPPFIALNEPESSLHPDLIGPLARLIATAARRSQVWLVTHSSSLADAIAATDAGKIRTVLKQKGETRVEGLQLSGEYSDDEDD
jgi:predicted ATPase